MFEKWNNTFLVSFVIRITLMNFNFIKSMQFEESSAIESYIREKCKTAEYLIFQINALFSYYDFSNYQNRDNYEEKTE